MATLYITEYTKMASHEGYGRPPELAMEPGTDQAVTFTTATQSAAFASPTRFVRVMSDTNCHVLFGSNPIATTTNQRLIADVEYWRAVAPGDKVSATT